METLLPGIFMAEMFMRIAFFILLIVFTTEVNSQHKIDIPEFQKLKPDDVLSEQSALMNYVDRFDVLIALSGFSFWSSTNNHVTALAHNTLGWYEIKVHRDSTQTDPFLTKINDSIGKIVWETILENQLFNIKDERDQDVRCIIKTDTIKKKRGKTILIVETISDIDDGIDYLFEIITPKSYKKIYYNEPQQKSTYCPSVNEYQWITNCINAFEKHLGN